MTDEQNWRHRGVFLTSLAFYLLVALEFFYMASPFAAYFYGVYGPGLDWLAQNSTASELLTFFMPHIVAETRSWMIDAHTMIGLILFIGGLLAFALGAIQIYGRKLMRGQEVRGGLYAYIRHPQYLALIVSSFGMLLVWPRFLVLLGFVVILFVYIMLAKIEERRCLRQYDGYAEYLKTSGAFLPRAWERPFRALQLPANATGRAISLLCFIGAAIGSVYAIGLGIQYYSINSLYAVHDDQSVTISVTQLNSSEIEKIEEIARRSPEITGALAAVGEGLQVRLINYVLPTAMYISEIPMHLPDGTRTGHKVPNDFDRDKYKIIFTRAVVRDGKVPKNLDILRKAINKEPVIEAWIDRRSGLVDAVYLPPEHAFYNGMPVPVF